MTDKGQLNRFAYYKGRAGYRGPNQAYEKLVQCLLKPGMNLLDVGCGRTFPRADKWLSTGARVCGIDPVADSTTLPEGVQVFQGSADEMPFADQEFDVITSRAVLEHLEDPGKTFQELHRVLRPGGSIVLLTPSKYDYVSLAARLIPNRFHAKIVRTIEGRDEADTFPTFYRANSQRQIRRLAMNAHLELRRLEYLDQSPYGLGPYPLLYRLARHYHHLIRSVRSLRFLSGWILCVLSKPYTQM